MSAEPQQAVPAATSKPLLLWSLGCALVLGGATALYSYWQSQKERKKTSILQKKSESAKEQEQGPSFLRRQPRRACFYFDQNDELVDQETAEND